MSNIRLDSWKSIAGYLRRGVRTVQRWHTRYGMPVHHFGSAKGCVFAYSADLDRWLTHDAHADETRAIPERTASGPSRSERCLAEADAMWELRSERNLAAITSLYRAAVDENPCNYPALVGLSRSLIAGALMGVVDGFIAYPSATEALRRVPRDSSEGAGALCAAGWLKTAYEHRWREARAAFDAVLRNNPTDSFALAGRALLLLAGGMLPEAFECAWSAWTENPLASPLSFLAAWIQYLNRDDQEALQLLADCRASGAYSSLHAAVEGLVVAHADAPGDNLERVASLSAEFPHSQVLEGVLGYLYAASGHPGKAWELLGNVMQPGRRNKNSGYLLALILLGLGEKQEAAVSLQRSFSEGSLWSLGFRSDPILQSLRGERHFDALLRRLAPEQESGKSSNSSRGEFVARQADEASGAQHGNGATHIGDRTVVYEA